MYIEMVFQAYGRDDFDFVLWIVLHFREQNCSRDGFTARVLAPADFDAKQARATIAAVCRRQRYAGQFGLRALPDRCVDCALGTYIERRRKGIIAERLFQTI